MTGRDTRYYSYYSDLDAVVDTFEIPGRSGEWCCYMTQGKASVIAYGGGPLEAITLAGRKLVAM